MIVLVYRNYKNKRHLNDTISANSNVRFEFVVIELLEKWFYVKTTPDINLPSKETDVSYLLRNKT